MTRLRGAAASAGQARTLGAAASAGQARTRGSAASARQARHFVTDRRRFGLSIDDLVARAVTAARAGVDVIQIRERDLPDAQLVALVRRIVDATAGTPSRVLVNDRADIAIVAGAAGVHLRADSAPASRVRTMTPPGFLIGRSVHSIDEVDAAAADAGCDYLMFGTVFRSTGKPAGHPEAGIAALEAVCRRSPVPIIAIGGMNAHRAAEIAAAGAAGFASVEMYMCLTPLPQVV